MVARHETAHSLHRLLLREPAIDTRQIRLADTRHGRAVNAACRLDPAGRHSLATPRPAIVNRRTAYSARG